MTRGRQGVDSDFHSLLASLPMGFETQSDLGTMPSHHSGLHPKQGQRKVTYIDNPLIKAPRL